MALELMYLASMEVLEAVEDWGPDLSAEERKRRDRRVPRIALRRYSESSFYYLFHSGNDQALLNCCAVDHVVFQELLDMFKPVYDKWTCDDSTGKIRPITFTKDGKPKTEGFDSYDCFAVNSSGELELVQQTANDVFA